MAGLQGSQGFTRDRAEMGVLLTEHFGGLFADIASADSCSWILGELPSEAVPLIDCAVIIKAVGAMKSGKTCSEDRLVAEMLFPLPVEGMLVLCVLFREVLRSGFTL